MKRNTMGEPKDGVDNGSTQNGNGLSQAQEIVTAAVNMICSNHETYLKSIRELLKRDTKV